MSTHNYRFQFDRTVSARDIHETLLQALLAIECLHGRARLKMDGRYRLDRAKRLLTIDATTQVGVDLAKVFTGHATLEFGDGLESITRETAQTETADRCSCAPTSTKVV